MAFRIAIPEGAVLVPETDKPDKREWVVPPPYSEQNIRERNRREAIETARLVEIERLKARDEYEASKAKKAELNASISAFLADYVKPAIPMPGTPTAAPAIPMPGKVDAPVTEAETGTTDKPLGSRERTAYLNTIAVLLNFVKEPRPGRDSEDKIIKEMIENYSDKYGISQRSLQGKFAEAKRSLQSE